MKRGRGYGSTVGLKTQRRVVCGCGLSVRVNPFGTILYHNVRGSKFIACERVGTKA